MINAIFLWTGRIFWGAATLILLGVVFVNLSQWGRKKYPVLHLKDKEKLEVIENWLNKKSFHNFKEIYFKMFLLPPVWWWRPCYRIWRIIRNTWLNHRYQECVHYLKTHQYW